MVGERIYEDIFLYIFLQVEGLKNSNITQWMHKKMHQIVITQIINHCRKFRKEKILPQLNSSLQMAVRICVLSIFSKCILLAQFLLNIFLYADYIYT